MWNTIDMCCMEFLTITSVNKNSIGIKMVMYCQNMSVKKINAWAKYTMIFAQHSSSSGIPSF